MASAIVNRVLSAVAKVSSKGILDKLLTLFGVSSEEIKETSRTAFEMRLSAKLKDITDVSELEGLFGDKPDDPLAPSKKYLEEDKKQRMQKQDWKKHTRNQWNEAFRKAVEDYVVDHQHLDDFDFYKYVAGNAKLPKYKKETGLGDQMIDEACSHVIANIGVLIRHINDDSKKQLTKDPYGRFDWSTGDPNVKHFEVGANFLMKVVGRNPDSPWVYEVVFKDVQGQLKDTKYNLNVSTTELKLAIQGWYKATVTSLSGTSATIMIPQAKRKTPKGIMITTDQLPKLIKRGLSDFQYSPAFTKSKEKAHTDLQAVLMKRVELQKDVEALEGQVKALEEQLSRARSDQVKEDIQGRLRELIDGKKGMKRKRVQLEELVDKEKSARRKIPVERFKDVVDTLPADVREMVDKYPARELSWEGGKGIDYESAQSIGLRGVPPEGYSPNLLPGTTYTESDVSGMLHKMTKNMDEEGAVDSLSGVPYKVFLDLVWNQINTIGSVDQGDLAGRLTQHAEQNHLFQDPGKVRLPKGLTSIEFGEILSKLRKVIRGGTRIVTPSDLETHAADLPGWSELMKSNRRDNEKAILRGLQPLEFDARDAKEIMREFKGFLLSSPNLRKIRNSLIREKLRSTQEELEEETGRTAGDLALGLDDLVDQLEDAWKTPTVAKLKPLYLQAVSFSDQPGMLGQIREMTVDGFADRMVLVKTRADYTRMMDIVEMFEDLAESGLSMALTKRVQESGTPEVTTETGEVKKAWELVATYPMLRLAIDIMEAADEHRPPWMGERSDKIREEIEKLDVDRSKRKHLIDRFNRLLKVLIGRQEALDRLKAEGDSKKIEIAAQKLLRVRDDFDAIFKLLSEGHAETDLVGRSQKLFKGAPGLLRKILDALLHNPDQFDALLGRGQALLESLNNFPTKLKGFPQTSFFSYRGAVEELLKLMNDYSTSSRKGKEKDIDVEFFNNQVERAFDKLGRHADTIQTILGNLPSMIKKDDKKTPDEYLSEVLAPLDVPEGRLNLPSVDEKLTQLNKDLDKALKYEEEWEKEKAITEQMHTPFEVQKVTAPGTPVKHGIDLIGLVKDLAKELRVWILRGLNDRVNDKEKLAIYTEFNDRFPDVPPKEITLRNKIRSGIISMAEGLLMEEEKAIPLSKQRRTRQPISPSLPGGIQNSELVKKLHEKNPDLLKKLQAIFA